jgi:hypothetical protein
MAYIDEGKYRAKAVTDGRLLGEDSDPYAEVTVRIEEEGPAKGKEIDWRGRFKTAKQIDYTIDVLNRFGWKGKSADDLAPELAGIEGTEIEVEIENWKGKDGKERTSVKYVNALGGSKGKRESAVASEGAVAGIRARAKAQAALAPPPAAESASQEDIGY